MNEHLTCADLSNCRCPVPARSGTSGPGQRRFTVERPARECGSGRGQVPDRVGGQGTLGQNKKPSPPANRRMKAFDESHPAPAGQAGLILLFDGEVGPVKDRDEHNQADILTSGLTSLPPSRPLIFTERNSGLVGVCNPLQWRNRPRFSRGSLTPDRDDDGPQVHQTFKERKSNTRRKNFVQEKTPRNFYPASPTGRRTETNRAIPYPSCA